MFSIHPLCFEVLEGTKNSVLSDKGAVVTLQNAKDGAILLATNAKYEFETETKECQERNACNRLSKRREKIKKFLMDLKKLTLAPLLISFFKKGLS